MSATPPPIGPYRHRKPPAGYDAEWVRREFVNIEQRIPNNAALIWKGTGSPNGVITADPGAVYLNESGGANVTLWIKESGIGTNTGWVGK